MKLRMIGIIIVLSVILGACAADPMVRWGQLQQTYNTTEAEVIRLREPCVASIKWLDGGPDNPLCFINDESMIVIKEVRDNLRELLDRVQAAAEVGNTPKAEEYIRQAEAAMEDFLFYQLRAVALEN